MYTIAPGTADPVPSAWLDEGSASSSSTLYAGKADPPPPPRVDTSIVNGTSGDDTLQGSTGDNKLYGGKGEDTAVYRGVLDDYELTFDASTWQYRLVDKVSGRDGTDQLHNIERLQFDGLAVLLDGKGGASLEDGTQLLAPYVPPPPTGGEPDSLFITLPFVPDLFEVIALEPDLLAWNTSVTIDFVGVAHSDVILADA